MNSAILNDDDKRLTVATRRDNGGILISQGGSHLLLSPTELNRLADFIDDSGAGGRAHAQAMGIHLE